MARITVEDCIDKFPSRFELVLVASNRARKLHSGDNPTVDRDNDKNTVIALREIADETITVENVKNDLIEEYQTLTLNDEEEVDNGDDSNLINENNSSAIEEIDTNSINQFATKEESAEEESAEKESAEEESEEPSQILNTQIGEEEIISEDVIDNTDQEN